MTLKEKTLTKDLRNLRLRNQWLEDEVVRQKQEILKLNQALAESDRKFKEYKKTEKSLRRGGVHCAKD